MWDPPPEVKGLCRRCHQKLVDSRKRWDGWLGATAPTRLLSTAARFPLAWMGAMFPMTPLGHMMVRWLGPDGKNVVPSIDAVLLVATVGSVFLASVPMAVFLEPILDFVSNDDEDRAPDWRRLLPSLGLGLLLLALSRTLILLDPDLQPLLRRDIAPISALVGGVAGCLISFVGMSAIWFIRADKRAFDVKNHRVTEIIECANQILGARSEEEYMRFLRRIIEDGLRASRYVLYRYDRAHRTYESHIWIGFEDSESDPSPFAPGDPCPPGQVADLGHALLEGTFQWKAIIGADVQDDGSKLCLPIGSQKHPGLLLSVHDFESNFTGRDVIAITEILCSTLSRGWENVSPPDA